MSFNLVLNNAVRLHEQGRLDEAEAMYRQLLEISPEQTDVLYLLGTLALQKKSFDSAIELLYKAVRLAPDVVAYEFTLAQALQDSGHPKEALEHYKSVLAKDDSLPETYHNIGIIYRFQGDTDEAKKQFQKALELRADFSSAYVNLALIERDAGNSDRALELLDQAVQADSSDAEAYAQIAPEELADCFPEIRAVTAPCKYADCRHLKEPDCAVRQAVGAGEIPKSRYESYALMLQESLNRKTY